jgi:serine protease Do
MEPGDVILEVNNRPISSRDELVQTVMSLKPGTTVPVTVLRDRQRRTLNVTIGEIDLDRESGQQAEGEGPAEDTTAGFGMALGNLTAERARRLGVPAGTSGAIVVEVDPAGTAARSGLREGDVILQVNRRAVESAADASRVLQEVRSGGTALMLIWRQNNEIFLTVRKE